MNEVKAGLLPWATVSSPMCRVSTSQSRTGKGRTRNISILVEKEHSVIKILTTHVRTKTYFAIEFSVTYHTCTLFTTVPSRNPSSVREVMTIHTTAYKTHMSTHFYSAVH